MWGTEVGRRKKAEGAIKPKSKISAKLRHPGSYIAPTVPKMRQHLIILLSCIVPSSCFIPRGKSNFRHVQGLRPVKLSRAATLTLSAVDSEKCTPRPWDELDLYAEMCRVDNLPASFAFVAAGAVAATGKASDVWNIQVLLTALCTMIITATSMVTNDYFDYKIGTDVDDCGNVLVRQALTPEQAKNFVGKFYSILLLLISTVPAMSVRLFLMTGSISTFIYTREFKPKTWLKNISVAFICAVAPLVGGISASGSIGQALSGTRSHCGGLVAALFCGIMSREILMDVVDSAADEASGVVTVPVRYGKR